MGAICSGPSKHRRHRRLRLPSYLEEDVFIYEQLRNDKTIRGSKYKQGMNGQFRAGEGLTRAQNRARRGGGPEARQKVARIKRKQVKQRHSTDIMYIFKFDKEKDEIAESTARFETVTRLGNGYENEVDRSMVGSNKSLDRTLTRDNSNKSKKLSLKSDTTKRGTPESAKFEGATTSKTDLARSFHRYDNNIPLESENSPTSMSSKRDITQVLNRYDNNIAPESPKTRKITRFRAQSEGAASNRAKTEGVDGFQARRANSAKYARNIIRGAKILRTKSQGGADQGMPIIVSRVAPNTPADLCIPRLNEGDQVLYINGRDVSQHTHEQVVMFIRASRETHSGELVLVVRPNIYMSDADGGGPGAGDANPEPDLIYIPDVATSPAAVAPHSIPATGDPLAGSIMLLSESLESGAALAQFEQMYRKKPGLTHNAARANDNICKNRYRDISPYDQSRVFLKGQDGDYINANYVNMEIPGSGVVNRYIAAQGPLPNTCKDFWQMIWEQQCRLVVMLTTKVERGRVKCHQYWPDLYETMDYGQLQVTCLKEEQSASFAFREFTLVNIEDGQEERHIRQMQYLAWPDHGVPDDSSDFLSFVMRVRQNRMGMVEPTVVHCSAGIGRTGVLITMETAMCLMEANQPIYPLDIVRQMRDQRAMLIQTSSQYKFVCEAITRVYHDKIVKPIDDYKR